jgi:hypothetical protein
VTVNMILALRIIQTLSLITSVTAVLAIAFYWRRGMIAPIYLIPPFVAYLGRIAFYFYILVIQPQSSIIITLISAHLVLFELSVGLAILMAIGRNTKAK